MHCKCRLSATVPFSCLRSRSSQRFVLSHQTRFHKFCTFCSYLLSVPENYLLQPKHTPVSGIFLLVPSIILRTRCWYFLNFSSLCSKRAFSAAVSMPSLNFLCWRVYWQAARASKEWGHLQTKKQAKLSSPDFEILPKGLFEFPISNSN